MTADEVRSVVFQNATIGGYKKSDVDLFLDEVAVCIESMTAKIRALEKEKFESGRTSGAPAIAQSAQKAPEAAQIPKKAAPQEAPKAEAEKPSTGADGVSDIGLQSLLLRAQKLAEQIESEAKEAASQLLQKSAEDAKDIIARADSQAEDTTQKANAILAEAERKEASISAAARAEAENIINEAVARSGQMLTATREKLKAEQESCEKLRTEFKQVRSVIVGFYEEQLRELRAVDLSRKAVEQEAPSLENTAASTPKAAEKADEKKASSDESKAEPAPKAAESAEKHAAQDEKKAAESTDISSHSAPEIQLNLGEVSDEDNK